LPEIFSNLTRANSYQVQQNTTRNILGKILVVFVIAIACDNNLQLYSIATVLLKKNTTSQLCLFSLYCFHEMV